MNEDDFLTDLVKKIEAGTATDDEKLTLLQYLNYSTELLLKFIEEVKVTQTPQENEFKV